jgi:hypothetical protein
VEKALKLIGAELMVLNERDRFAVLARVNGAFGVKPKGSTQPSQRTPAEEKKKPVPRQTQVKKPFNEKFLETIFGQLLNETSRQNRKVARTSKFENTQPFNELHKWLLAKKAKAKEGEVHVLAPQGFDAHKAVGQFLGGYQAISESNPDMLQTPASIFDLGWCLISGKTPESAADAAREIPANASWPEVARLVPRADAEAEERAFALLASRKQKKQQKQAGAESQTPPAKRAKAATADSKEPDPLVATKGESTMELEAEEPL